MSTKTVLITGASRGLGLECARILGQKLNANVVALSRSVSDELGKLKETAGDRLEIVQGDVSKDADQKKAVDLAVSKFGSLDGLILNAGILDPMKKVVNADIAEFKKLFDVNFFSLVTMLQAAIPHLRKSHGKVIFVSSGAATGNYSAWGAYNTSKAALNSLCRTVANEEQDITFVAVRPGVLVGDMQDQIVAKGKGEMTDEDYQRFVDIRDNGKRLPPSQPGHVIAALSINAEKGLSGEFVNWADDNMSPYAG